MATEYSYRKRSRQRKLRRKRRMIILSVCAVLLIALIIVICAVCFRNKSKNTENMDNITTEIKENEKIKDGVFIQSVAVGGKNYNEALQVVDEYIETLSSKELIVSVNGNSVTTTLGKLGLSCDTEKYVRDAFELNENESISLQFDLNSSKVDKFVKNKCTDYNIQAKNAGLKRKNGEFKITKSKTGKQVDEAARVCLIGKTIADKLYPGQDPIGQDIRIKDVAFSVIGVLAAKGADGMGNDQDDCLILPWTSIRMRLMGASGTATISKGGAANNVNKASSTSTYSTTGVNFYPGCDLQPYSNSPHPLRTRTVDAILVKIKSKESATPAMDEMTPVLRRQHKLEPGVLDDFELRDRSQFIKMVTGTSETMSKLLIAVAMISLVVGGVGIMNIMMVSVTERTREIGLRMAVGARPRDIMQQFLLEAVLLCLAGGIIGIIAGRIASELVSKHNGWPVATSPLAMVLAVSVAAVIGIIFGWYPAFKASRLDPIDALHHE